MNDLKEKIYEKAKKLAIETQEFLPVLFFKDKEEVIFRGIKFIKKSNNVYSIWDASWDHYREYTKRNHLEEIFNHLHDREYKLPRLEKRFNYIKNYHQC